MSPLLDKQKWKLLTFSWPKTPMIVFVATPTLRCSSSCTVFFGQDYTSEPNWVRLKILLQGQWDPGNRPKRRTNSGGFLRRGRNRTVPLPFRCHLFTRGPSETYLRPRPHEKHSPESGYSGSGHGPREVTGDVRGNRGPSPTLGRCWK